MATVNAYLTFTDTCEEAFTFYEEVFNQKASSKMRFSDMPGAENLPENVKNKILHISLTIGESRLMGSDSPSEMGQPEVTQGNNFALLVAPDSEEEAKRIFDALSDGGSIIMNLENTFWGALYGQCTDKFGIQWMVNYEYPQSH